MSSNSVTSVFTGTVLQLIVAFLELSAIGQLLLKLKLNLPNARALVALTDHLSKTSSVCPVK